ncbi:hypothetical protein, partial [Hydrogenophaga defluvii]
RLQLVIHALERLQTFTSDQRDLCLQLGKPPGQRIAVFAGIRYSLNSHFQSSVLMMVRGFPVCRTGLPRLVAPVKPRQGIAVFMPA